jgi:histidyl-tRNA synthetase
MTERGISYEIQRRLVRGLDYYNGAVFEVAAEGIGAQDAVAGGGRYDGLYGELGGRETPCAGFSIGMERLLTVLDRQGGAEFWARHISGRTVYLAPLDAGRGTMAFFQQTALELCEKGFRVEMTPGETSLSRHLKKANQTGARFLVVLGPDELAKRQFTVKDMNERKQAVIDRDQLAAHLEGALRA